MNFNILPERMAQLEAQAIAEAQAEFNNEIAAETQAAFEKAYVAAVKAQKLAELRANKAKEIEKTVYEMLESAGITKEARDFIKIHESQQKALAQIGKTISVKDNESVVDSKLKKILENLKYSEAEIQELLLENQKNQIFSNDEDYDAIKSDAEDYFANKYQTIRFDEKGNEINEMTTNDMVF